MEIEVFRRSLAYARSDVADAGDQLVSCVGHEDVAAVISEQLGIEVPVNRVSIKLKSGDIILVAQYVGPRLPEGTTQLPEGAELVWYLVIVHDHRG